MSQLILFNKPFGVLTQFSGSQRIGMSSIFVFLAAGAAMMLTLPKEEEVAG